MQALRLAGGQVRYTDSHPDPRPQTGEVPVRVIQAGICETDLQLVRGYMGFEGILGHEFVGLASEGKFAGRRVVGEINCACGDCELCEEGLAGHCPHRSVLGILNHDGAFAETICVPQENLHLVPDELSDDEAVFAEPLAAALQIAEQLDLDDFAHAIVLGDGRLGNLCAQVLAMHGCRTTLIGKHAAKLTLLDEMGIDTALLADVTPERSTDLVIDCTGSPTGLETACSFVRPRGTIVLKTTVAGDTGPNLAPLVIDEITLVGSRCGPFDAALKALAAGDIHVTPLISARFPLSDGERALKQAAKPSHLKVLLDIDNG